MYSKAQYEKHKEKRAAYSKQYAIKNRAKIAAYAREYRAKNKDKTKKYDLKKYGLSANEYENLLKKQDNRCAICLEPEDTVIKGKLIQLSVDHCHKTGKVRGLLCRKCNHALGNFKDNTNIIKNALLYLWGEL